VGIVLLGLIALAVSMDANGTDFLYLWSDEEALKNDHLVIHKSAFLIFILKDLRYGQK
jgi:hypothetical protein